MANRSRPHRELYRSLGQSRLAMGARSDACVDRLGWTIVLSACSLSSIEVLGRDLMANRAWSRRAKRLPMTCWNGALRSATGSASIGVSSDDLLVIATRAPTSDDRDVAASHERWVRGRFVGDSKVPPNFERLRWRRPTRNGCADERDRCWRCRTATERKSLAWLG